MKLYDGIGPNPKVVRMFLDEKELELPVQQVDLIRGENRKGPHLMRNISGQLPALELDNGEFISEVTVICEYLEELYPEPCLIGSSAAERAVIRMWTRKIDLAICEPMSHGFRFSDGLAFFEKRIPCYPEAATGFKQMAQNGLLWLDGQLEGKRFIAGGQLSLADIMLFAMLQYFNKNGQPLTQELTNVCGWFAQMEQRSSARA